MSPSSTGRDRDRSAELPAWPPTPTARQSLLGLVLGLTLGFGVFLASLTDVVRPFELKALDFRFAFRGERAVAESPIAVVSLDDATIGKYGWPPTRDLYAAVIGIVAQGGARVIAVDTWFSHPSSDSAGDRHTGLCFLGQR